MARRWRLALRARRARLRGASAAAEARQTPVRSTRVHGIATGIAACWRPPHDNDQVTVRVSFTRDGAVIGEPRIVLCAVEPRPGRRRQRSPVHAEGDPRLHAAAFLRRAWLGDRGPGSGHPFHRPQAGDRRRPAVRNWRSARRRGRYSNRARRARLRLPHAAQTQSAPIDSPDFRVSAGCFGGRQPRQHAPCGGGDMFGRVILVVIVGVAAAMLGAFSLLERLPARAPAALAPAPAAVAADAPAARARAPILRLPGSVSQG